MTFRASYYLAAIAGSLGLFAMGPAHADPRLGAALHASSTNSIVAKVGHFDDRDSPCYRPRYRERKPCHYRRWRHREVRRHYPRPYPRPAWWGPRPHQGNNYEVYTYRRPYARGPRMDVQMVYGWYRGYYSPYPWYAGDGYVGY